MPRASEFRIVAINTRCGIAVPTLSSADVPNPVKIDVGFASYESKVEVVGSKLRYSREFIRRDIRVDINQIEKLRKLEGVIGADQMTAAVLKRV